MDTSKALIDLILARRSCRKYQPHLLPSRKELETIVECARRAPCGRDRQLCHFLVITDQSLLARLTALVSERMEDFSARDFRHGAPALVVVCHRKDGIVALQDAACAMENMMLAAWALGLGSCWVNQLGNLSDDPGLRSLLAPLGLGEEERVCASLTLGAPAEPLDQRREITGNPVAWIAGD